MAYFENRKGSLEEAIKTSLTDGSKEEYQKFFNSALKKFKIDLPADLKTDEDKKKFFNYVDKNYKGEKSEAVKTLIGKLKEWSFSTTTQKVEEKVEYVEYKFKNKNDAMKAKKMLDAVQLMGFEINDDNIRNGEISVDAGNKDMTKYHKEVMSKFRPKVMTQESSKLGASRKSMNDVKEQLTAINQRKLSMRDALRQVWSGQEAKNPFDNGQKVKKERKDFAKGAKAATGEPAAKVEIDPKIKD